MKIGKPPMLTFEPEPVPVEMDESGTARVGGTRLRLDTVVGRYDAGDTPQEIAESFPPLTLADLYAVLCYVERHRAEVDAYLKVREEEAARIRAEVESFQGPQTGLRERLMERWEQRRRAAG